MYTYYRFFSNSKKYLDFFRGIRQKIIQDGD